MALGPRPNVRRAPAPRRCPLALSGHPSTPEAQKAEVASPPSLPLGELRAPVSAFLVGRDTWKDSEFNGAPCLR